jgi:hypothetical protein
MLSGMSDDPGAPPVSIAVRSVHFAHPGSQDAIVMRDPATDAPLGERPEWIAGVRNEPAAYVRACRPTVSVVFAAAPGTAALDATIGAVGEGSGPGITPRPVSLAFDAAGESPPVLFELAAPLADQVGSTRLAWAWFLRGPSGEVPIGATDHLVHTTWRAPLAAAPWATPVYGSYPAPSPNVAVDNWAYAPMVAWTSGWAAGAGSPKEVCDAIAGNVARSGLAYYVSAWDVRTMLLQGGGMCGGWYKMFQGLAAAQGVPVLRRSYSVDWRCLTPTEAMWCAIVVSAPGINRAEPVEAPSAFHDADHGYRGTVPIEDVTLRRYRFWGEPGGIHDGHCINFLEADGRWYLYDVCFLDHAIALDRFELPPADHSRLEVGQQGTFRSAYLDRAVDFMLGSLEADGRYYESVHGACPGKAPSSTPCPPTNGLSVRTDTIPDEGPGITFLWGP